MQPDALRARRENVAVAEYDEAGRPRSLLMARCEHGDEFGADACGFARGDRDRGEKAHYDAETTV
jgi:hypothetical protein